MSTHLTVRRFTVEQYHRMGETGVIGPDERVELLDGEIVEMAPIGSEHAGCVARTTKRFNRTLGDDACVWPQNPVVLDDWSEPQPDLMLLKPRRDEYASAHPRPEDVLLVIEVCDTTYERDRDEKLPRYAAAGIREAWLVNLPEARIEVYRRPTKAGYRSVRRIKRGGEIAPLAFPAFHVAAEDILGPA